MFFRRLLFCLVTAVFFSQTADFSLLKGLAGSKTCCGRKICMCTHAKGGFCDFKHRGMPQNRSMAGRSDQSAHGISGKASASAAGFTKAPCHSESSKASPAALLQHYDLAPLSGGLPDLTFCKTVSTQLFPPVSPAGALMDRPPRFFA